MCCHEEITEPESTKNPAVILLGGLKGGKARAEEAETPKAQRDSTESGGGRGGEREEHSIRLVRFYHLVIPRPFC